MRATNALTAGIVVATSWLVLANMTGMRLSLQAVGGLSLAALTVVIALIVPLSTATQTEVNQ